MKLTNEQMKQAVTAVKVQERDAVRVIIQMGGDKEDYQQLLKMVNHHYVNLGN